MFKMSFSKKSHEIGYIKYSPGLPQLLSTVQQETVT